MNSDNQKHTLTKADIVDQIFEKAGLTKIDHVLISHFHGDHEGGLNALSKMLPIDHFYDHADVIGALPRQRLARPAIARSESLAGHHHKPGQRLELDVDVEWSVGQGLKIVVQHRTPEYFAIYGRPIHCGHAIKREAKRTGSDRRYPDR